GGERPRRPRSHPRRQPAEPGRRHPAQPSRHDDRVDRRQPVDQAGQPHAQLRSALGRGARPYRRLPGSAEVSETGFDHSLYDRFPTSGPRPEGELEKLEKAWRVPPRWGLLTEVNNNYVGFWYVAVAFLFFILAGILALVMRVQLAAPLQDIVPMETYNQVFTMHGT